MLLLLTGFREGGEVHNLFVGVYFATVVCNTTYVEYMLMYV